jgi:hypothetical protein
MYLTEEEARGKWCPHGRSFVSAEKLVGQYNIGPINTVLINGKQHQTNCIASECMMWRWRVPNLRGRQAIGCVGVESRTPQEMEFDKRNPDGYCGLGGKP